MSVPAARSGMSSAFGKFEWALAGRYLRARRRDSYISVIAIISLLGIMLGVATLIVVMAVMTGFRADLLDRIVGVNGHARIESRFASLADMDATVAKIRTIPGIVSARPMMDGQIMASVGNSVRGMVLRGFPVADLEQLPALRGKILQGRLEDLVQESSIAVGARLAETYGLMVGDTLTLISPQGVVTPFGSAPNVENFTVKAVFEIGLSDYDMNIAFTNYDTLAAFLARPPQTGVIEFDIAHADDIDRMSGIVRQALGEGFRIFDWKSSNSTLAGALEVERNVMFLILTLILLVAALNIVSGMVMLVRDKGRDIAILRAMGTTRGAVMRIFFITGAAVGVVGTVLGVGLGVVFSAYIEEIRQFLIWLTGAELFPAQIYFLDKMPATIVWQDVFSVVMMALGLSFVSTLYPAWRAARLDPVEALRYE